MSTHWVSECNVYRTPGMPEKKRVLYPMTKCNGKLRNISRIVAVAKGRMVSNKD